MGVESLGVVAVVNNNIISVADVNEYIMMMDFKTFEKLLKKYATKVDNWANCDCLKFKIILELFSRIR